MQQTQVAIIGAGPSGLMLARMLRLAGIDCMILERKSGDYVLSRVRAGLLERGTVDLLRRIGAAERLERESLIHDGCELIFDGEPLRIDFKALTGAHVVVYGQTEVTRDLMSLHAAAGTRCLYDADVLGLEGLTGDKVHVTYTHGGATHTLACDFVAGCDGFHGVSRRSIPAERVRTYERVYPFGWLGVLADVKPVSEELVYARNDDGFALASMRSATRVRAYIQVANSYSVDDWPEEAFWHAFKQRLGPNLASKVATGPAIEKSIAPLRSFVAEPMRYGRLFLAGDAAHIVPPTGAKGLNLAAADVRRLGEAFESYYRSGSMQQIDGYAAKALARVWKAERFSWWMTMLMHTFPEDDAFDRAMQRTEFAYLASSRAAQTALAENYVGLLYDA